MIESETKPKRTGERLVDRGVITPSQLDASLVAQKSMRLDGTNERLDTVVDRLGFAAVKRRTGEILIDRGVITEAQLDAALRQQRVMREQGHLALIGEVLLSLRFADELSIEEAINASSGADGSAFSQLLSTRVCNKYRINPVRTEGDVLYVQSDQKLSEAEKLRIMESCTTPGITSIRVVATDRRSLDAALQRQSGGQDAMESWIRRLRSEIDGNNLRGAVNAMVMEALEMRASDIHLDKGDDLSSWISYRVDGNLQLMHLVPAKIMAAIFMRIKTESGMDSSEVRKSQDGRMSFEVRNRKIDVRVASQPVASGETITLRILNQSSMKRLSGMFDGQPEVNKYLQGLTRINGKSGGLVVISGATGSGKSTTLYALAQELDRDRINVMTVEDPVEYTLPLCRQIQLNQFLDQRATDMERSLLRQDPDVVIFGELRDQNFAQAALKLTESGHLCLTTVHAIDAIQTIERLQDLVGSDHGGSMMFVLSGFLKSIINQRLVGRLCSCAVPASKEYLSHHEHAIQAMKLIPGAPGVNIRMRVGCEVCKGGGYYDRAVAHESILISEEEGVRVKLARMFAGGRAAMDGLRDIPGVRFIPRSETLGALVSLGIVDLETAAHVLGVTE